MPDRGQRKIAGSAGQLTDRSVWELPGARWLQVTFEVSRDAVLAALPCDLTRTVPCYARLLVVDAPESPAGPLRMAALLAGGRFEMQPRNVLVQGVAGSGTPALSSAFGEGFVSGEVTLTREGASVDASVGGDLARITVPAMRAVDATMLRWDPWIGVAAADGSARLVDYTIEPAIDQAFLAKGVTMETGAARDSHWHAFRCLNMISACYAEGTLVFGERATREAVIE